MLRAMTDLAASPEQLDISALGVDVVLHPTGSDCPPGDLAFEVRGTPRGMVTHRHVHIGQVETLEVIAGEMRLELDGRTHLLRAGDRMAVPAGVAHRQRPSGSEPGRVRVTVSPAGRSEQFLRSLAAMSSHGQFNRAGLPRPVAGARLIRDFGDTGHATVPPVALQRLFSTVMLAGAAGLGALRPRLAAGARHVWREYAFVDEWDVAAPPEAVYDALADGRTYPQWWRPVYIDVDADGPPVLGGITQQHFKGRLPYHLRTRSQLVALERPRLIEVDVDGDLRGHGVWTLTATATGTHIRFDWTVHADRWLLRVLTPLLRPAFRSNHNWAIARAVDGLEPYLLARPQPSVRGRTAPPPPSNGGDSMSAENEALVRRFFEEFCNDRRAEVADEVIADDYVSHGPQAPPAEGPDGVRERVGLYQEAVDGHWDVQEMISTGDRVIARWIGTGTHRGELMGIDATGKPISVEAISVFRIAEGKIAEEWTVWDALGLLQQVGAVPAPA